MIVPPAHVSIVGLGPSSHHYLNLVEALGGRHAYCDETWVINTYGDVLAHDRVFHMDDVRMTVDDETPKIKTIVAWLRTHPGPIYTSRPHPDFPGMVAYPLEEVINRAGYDYFNNSAAYAIAFALAIGVKKISLFGIDFAPDGSHDAPGGRACCEYWVGRAMQRGIEVQISGRSSLLDTSVPLSEKLYGYETLNVASELIDGKVRVKITPKELSAEVTVR